MKYSAEKLKASSDFCVKLHIALMGIQYTHTDTRMCTANTLQKEVNMLKQIVHLYSYLETKAVAK